MKARKITDEHAMRLLRRVGKVVASGGDPTYGRHRTISFVGARQLAQRGWITVTTNGRGSVALTPAGRKLLGLGDPGVTRDANALRRELASSPLTAARVVAAMDAEPLEAAMRRRELAASTDPLQAALRKLRDDLHVQVERWCAELTERGQRKAVAEIMEQITKLEGDVRRHERAAVVAYLRRGATLLGSHRLATAADDVEKGRHHAPR